MAKPPLPPCLAPAMIGRPRVFGPLLLVPLPAEVLAGIHLRDTSCDAAFPAFRTGRDPHP